VAIIRLLQNVDYDETPLNLYVLLSEITEFPVGMSRNKTGLETDKLNDHITAIHKARTKNTRLLSR